MLFKMTIVDIEECFERSMICELHDVLYEELIQKMNIRDRMAYGERFTLGFDEDCRQKLDSILKHVKVV